MSNGVDIVGVRLWGGVILSKGESSSVYRYAVYYKRDGAMYRSLVDAKDELDAWGKFARLIDGKPYETKVYYDPKKEQYPWINTKQSES